jgi:hypothetical protein
MSIPFTNILTYLKEMLESSVTTARVQIEPSVIGDAAWNLEVGIYLSKSARTERNLGSPDPYYSVLTMNILCSAYSPDGVYEACVARDALIGSVEDVLKTDRTLGGLVGQTQLGETTFETSDNEAGFFAGGIIEFRAVLMA